MGNDGDVTPLIWKGKGKPSKAFLACVEVEELCQGVSRAGEAVSKCATKWNGGTYTLSEKVTVNATHRATLQQHITLNYESPDYDSMLLITFFFKQPYDAVAGS